MVSYTVTKDQEGKSLFDLLEEVYPDFLIRAQDKALKNGSITYNGRRAYGDEEVAAGDKIDVYLSGDIVGVDLTPEIVYQDENFVIVDKPAGLLSFSDDGELNAVDMVEEYMKQQGEYCLDALMVPYLVYPLEKYVSGLLILAKHEEGYLFLVQALNQRRISRYYLCPVVGQADEQEELLAYHMADKTGKRARILGSFRKDSKPIVTRYVANAIGDTTSLIRVRPVTTTMHQIRAHLAYEKLPVLGDNLYGERRFNRKSKTDEIALWLQTVVFETGTGHEYAYMNKKRFESKQVCFPRYVYNEGLMNEEE